MNEKQKIQASDSFAKILTYVRALAPDVITFNKELINPVPLYVYPSLLRDFTCPENCGACCMVITPSLDYLPGENMSPAVEERMIPLQGGKKIFTDFQRSAVEKGCQYLNRTNGRCTIYQARPFPCDFELIKVMRFKDRYRLGQQKFGRAWNLRRVDDERGASCELFYGQKGVEEVERKLNRLRDWLVYFDVSPARIDTILSNIHVLKTGSPLRFEVKGGWK